MLGLVQRCNSIITNKLFKYFSSVIISILAIALIPENNMLSKLDTMFLILVINFANNVVFQESINKFKWMALKISQKSIGWLDDIYGPSKNRLIYDIMSHDKPHKYILNVLRLVDISAKTSSKVTTHVRQLSKMYKLCDNRYRTKGLFKPENPRNANPVGLKVFISFVLIVVVRPFIIDFSMFYIYYNGLMGWVFNYSFIVIGLWLFIILDSVLYNWYIGYKQPSDIVKNYNFFITQATKDIVNIHNGILLTSSSLVYGSLTPWVSQLSKNISKDASDKQSKDLLGKIMNTIATKDRLMDTNIDAAENEELFVSLLTNITYLHEIGVL